MSPLFKTPIFFSRSNPHHSILLAQCLKHSWSEIEYSAAPDYLLVEPELVRSKTILEMTTRSILCFKSSIPVWSATIDQVILNNPKLLEHTYF